MVLRIIAILMVICATAYAEIDPVSYEDVKDHQKIKDKLNQIIDEVNTDISKKASKADIAQMPVIRAKADQANENVRLMSNNLKVIRATVGDPGGTVTDVRTKFIKLMDTLDAVSTHVEVNTGK